MLDSLNFSGRPANHDLNFRRWSESKHAQYFTPIELARTMADGLSRFVPLAGLNVLDPTCGNGRLLKPFQEAGSRVLGIELDKLTAAHAQRVLGAKQVRIGDILDYRSHIKNQFEVVVTNPPYGIIWQPQSYFQTARYDGSIESQAATLEICHEALRHQGYLAAIIPSTTFTNEKDRRIKEFLYSHFMILARITLDHLFFEEYGIKPRVDVLLAQKRYAGDEESQTPVTAALDYLTEDVHEQIGELLRGAKDQHPDIETVNYNPDPPEVPNLSRLKIIQPDPRLRLTPHRISADQATLNFARFLNLFPVYNPVFGKESGAWDAYGLKSALLKRGTAASKNFFNAAGFELVIAENIRQKLEKERAKYQRLAIPIYRPRPHQLLAYFEEKPYTAKATVKDSEGVLLFQQGRRYLFRPGWIRHRETVKQEVKTVKGKEAVFIHDVDRGYLTFSIQTEAGLRVFKEIESADIALLTEGFELPRIKDLADVYPQQVESNRQRVRQRFGFLFDYQQEDLARLLLKDRIYLGYDMGGGKTVTGACWAALKGYRRILAVCQPGAVNNWVRELKKFGFTVKKLLTHRSVNKLLDTPKPATAVFYITSYQFLSLDTQRVYDAWTCIKHDKDGNAYHLVKDNTGRSCSGCGRRYEVVQRVCPECDSQEDWTGACCQVCGYHAWTYTSETTQYPAYKRIRKGVFDCLLLDEAQEAKSKNSFRGRAIRAIRTKGMALLTGTLMKGYIYDVFWNIGKLTGFGNVLFPYPYRGGSKMFLDEFGTYEYVSRQFANTLHEGRARVLPEVSNLNRFWRILASFTVRRLKDSMVELPPKHRHYELVALNRAQATAYRSIEQWAQQQIQDALHHEEPNMGKISNALWKLRFAASIPTDQAKLGDYAINSATWMKLERLVELVREIKQRGEQVVIYASLRSLVQAISLRLKRECLSHVTITASSGVDRRLALIDEFEMNGHVALVAGTNCANRAFTITSANNVIIANLEFSPEPTLQAEDRVHRTGQNKEVNVYYLLSENTIDQDMWELITKKGQAIRQAIDMEARDINVAELLQSKTELEVAMRVLGRRKTEQRTTTPTAPLPVEVHGPLSNTSTTKSTNRPADSAGSYGVQLELFFDLPE